MFLFVPADGTLACSPLPRHNFTKIIEKCNVTAYYGDIFKYQKQIRPSRPVGLKICFKFNCLVKFKKL